MSNELTNVRVEHSLEVTINTGNFENVRPGFRVSADVADGVHPNVAKQKLVALVEGWMIEYIKQVKEEL